LPFPQYSRGDFGTLPKKRKTYGRFLGIIFLEGLERRLWLHRKGLQGKRPHKIEKARKKV
jgi:hypothetical protein